MTKIFWVDNRFPTLIGGQVDFIDENGNRVYPSLGDVVYPHSQVDSVLPEMAERKGYHLKPLGNGGFEIIAES